MSIKIGKDCELNGNNQLNKIELQKAKESQSFSKISRGHESSYKHVSGSAMYVDDLPLPENSLHAYIGFSECSNGIISSLDLEAVRQTEGVVDVFTARNIPGLNDISPSGKMDEPILAEREVLFWGQPIFVVVAEKRAIARKAARLGRVSYQVLPPKLAIRDAEKGDKKLVTPGLKLSRGNFTRDFQSARNKLIGEIEIGGQDHFYLEGQIALAQPGEDDDMLVISSTQHPSEVQHMVSSALGVSSNNVTVQVRRMGGAFGGKETQSNLFAVIAAIAARRCNKTVKLRLDRDDDMIATGKRHDFIGRYKVGFDDNGKILALDVKLSARCGFSADLSGPITDRALFHLDNCYFLPCLNFESFPFFTNTVSNTAFRGFGGPQGMLVAERIMQEIAFKLGKDTLEVRKLNLYGKKDRILTPYYQIVEDNIIQRIIRELEKTSNYQERRNMVNRFNEENRIFKKGISLTPVKFGISFTATWYNQAGALVHIYTDGSIALNHGGTEMGQGLFTKVSALLAAEFDLPLSAIKFGATDTSKVPNTSATAASSGTDLNGMAVLNAASKLKKRLAEFAVKEFGVKRNEIFYKEGNVILARRKMPFRNFIKAAYLSRVQLFETGFYKTPKIHWKRELGKGRPFYYFAYGAAVSEVIVDTLTGEYQVERVDILHDVGESINPNIDLGQIEGGFIQGMGWLTTEELWWDANGKLQTHAPSTYKIPLASDRPRKFNINLVEWASNKEKTVKRSKAVGEPPFMLAISVHEALSLAISSTQKNKTFPSLDAPATPERVLNLINSLEGSNS